VSTYTKITDFAAKDSLLSGNPAKVVKGTEIGAEFDSIATADASNVKGPASSSASTIVRWDGTTGKLVKASTVTVDDTGNIVGTSFTGNVVGNVTGTASGNAASGANTDITSLNSPALGSATATTQTPGDNSTKVATTAFVAAATSGIGAIEVQGTFKNLQANANGTTAAVNVTADALAVMTAGNAYKTLYNLNLSANTGAASGAANSLDTGAWAFSTWYYVFVINGVSGTALLFSLSATAPTLPSGYTYLARVGSIRTQSATNFNPLAFKQYGRRVQYVVTTSSNVPNLPVMASGAIGNVSTPTWVSVAVSSFVPSTASKINATVGFNYGNIAMVAPNNSYGAAGASSNRPPIVIQGAAGIYTTANFDLLLESTSIYAAMAQADHILSCVGWEDNL
jgi:hypothetical protein